MKNSQKSYKEILADKKGPTDETKGGGSADLTANSDSILKDEPSTGAFQEEPKTEQPTPEAPKAQEQVLIIPAIKPAQNLELTLKTIKLLHQATIQRDNLLARIADLEEFEVELMGEGDELERNIYAGCRLVISDGKGKQFVTNTSKLIKKVADFVKETCNERLTEIEAEIVFPY